MLFNLTRAGNYSASREYLRGAFRYLTLSLTEQGNLTLSNLFVNFSASPHIKNLQNYSGYFHSNDDLLNRYAVISILRPALTVFDSEFGMLVHIRINYA